MFTKEDILARLQNGDTVDEIANEMSAALNDAHKAYQDEEAKRVEEEKAAAAKAQEENRIFLAKREAVNHMLDAMCDYLVASGEDEMLDSLHEIDTEKVVELLDGSIKFAKDMEELKHLQFLFPPIDKKIADSPFAVTLKPASIKKDADDIIKEFLKGI